MKKLIYVTIVTLLFFSCNKETNFVTFSGKIANKNIDSLMIFHPEKEYTKIIKLKEDGSFKDTLKVENGLFSMTNNNDFSLLYLINGDHIVMNFDAKNFEKTINFEGDHANENNFLTTSIANESRFFGKTQLMRLPKNEFDKVVTEYVVDFENRLVKDSLDVDFSNFQKKEIVNFKKYIEKEYLEKNYTNLVLSKGKVSPIFNNYENYKGGTTSLKDLKGKYVYIDVWATWCHPCKIEIPYLQEIEKQMHDKNIEFVSISIDEERDYTTWKNMVADKNLGGIQLYAKGDKNFTTGYRIRSIPRFILIDPKGNIVDANAPRPSNPQLKVLFNSLDI